MNNRTTDPKRHAIRLIAVVLILILAFGTIAPASFAVMPTRGDMLRYIPIAISIDASTIVVYGYFTNLNADCSVSNFRDFSMQVYVDNYMLASGSFSNIDSFEIEPEGVLYHTFIFPVANNYYQGTYICEDDDYAVISCTFDYTEEVYRMGGIK